MWHVTCDTWHVTHDTWHMTFDMLWGEHSLKISADWLTDLINHESVCRTAPATPGLLKNYEETTLKKATENDLNLACFKSFRDSALKLLFILWQFNIVLIIDCKIYHHFFCFSFGSARFWFHWYTYVAHLNMLQIATKYDWPQRVYLDVWSYCVCF